VARWFPWLLIALLATSCVLDPKGEDPSEFATESPTSGDDIGPTPPAATTPISDDATDGDDFPVDDEPGFDDATSDDTSEDTETETSTSTPGDQEEEDGGLIEAGLDDGGRAESVPDGGTPSDASTGHLDSDATTGNPDASDANSGTEQEAGSSHDGGGIQDGGAP
jgi:hypothetical protein